MLVLQVDLFRAPDEVESMAPMARDYEIMTSRTRETKKITFTNIPMESEKSLVEIIAHGQEVR